MKKTLCALVLSLALGANIQAAELSDKFNDFMSKPMCSGHVTMTPAGPAIIRHIDVNGDKKPDVEVLYPIFGQTPKGYLTSKNPLIYAINENLDGRINTATEIYLDKAMDGWNGNEEIIGDPSEPKYKI